MAGMISSLRGGGGDSVIRPIRECAAGQGMVFYLSDLNRLYSFVRVCLNYKQDIASTIDLIRLMKFVYTSSIRVYNT